MDFKYLHMKERGFAKSNGKDDNSVVLKNDALAIFDRFLEIENVKKTDIIIWGTSLGGAFATMNGAEEEPRQNQRCCFGGHF